MALELFRLILRYTHGTDMSDAQLAVLAAHIMQTVGDFIQSSSLKIYY